MFLLVDDKEICTLDIKFIPSNVAFIGKSPARFRELKLEMTNEEYYKHNEGIKEYNDVLSSKKKKKYAPIKLIKKIDLKGSGAGRQFRFSYLDGKPVMLFAQHQKRMYRDSFARLSCLTAFDIDGNIFMANRTS